jgi:hypothetical protein
VNVTLQEAVGLIVRHLLGAIGAGLVAGGLLSQDDANSLVNYGQEIVGAAGFFVAILWSAWQKSKQTEIVGNLAKMKKVAPASVSLAEAAQRGKEAVERLEQQKESKTS